MMKWILLIALLVPLCVRAQTCPCPQADTFSALETDNQQGPSKPFRGLMPDVAGGQCATDSLITDLAAAIPQPGAQFETVEAPGLGGIIFQIRLKSEFATITGTDAGTDGTDPCFRLDVHGLVHAPSPITFTDGCGVHMMTIQQPRYACVLGPPIGKTLVCFAARNIGVIQPLPPGFDRLEDVCALVDVL
jgi:hypothetical protein